MNDYTAICVWGYERKSAKLHLIHVFMDRLEFPDLQKMLPKFVKDWKIRCLYIEGRAQGVPLIQSLKKTINISLKELVPNKDKVLRANSVAPLAEDGRVSLYENIPNLPERLSELCSFPFIKNDDFVDAFVYGITVFRDEIMGGSAISGGKREKLPRILYDPYSKSGSRRTSTDVGKIYGTGSYSSAPTRYL